MPPEAAALRAEYDRSVRPWVDPDPVPGIDFERFGNLVRVTGRGRGFVESGVDVGLEGADLDAAIALHRDHFAARGESVVTFIPAAGRRTHDAASTRSPATSTMQARQFPSGR